MSLFNYLDEQIGKKPEDKSFMGMGTIWQEMGKPVIDSVDQGLLQTEDEPWTYEPFPADKFIAEGKASRGDYLSGVLEGTGANIADSFKLSGLGILNMLEESVKPEFRKGNVDTRRELADLIHQQMQERTPDDLTLTQQGFRGAIESAPITAVAMLTTMFTGQPLVGLSIMGGFVGAQEYDEARASGIEQGSAFRYGMMQGGIEGITERLSIKPLMRMFKTGGKEMLENAKEYVAKEIVGENAAEFGQSMVSWWYGLNELMQNPELSAKDKAIAQLQQQYVATIAASSMAGTTVGLKSGADSGQALIDALPEDHPLKQIVAAANVPVGSQIFAGPVAADFQSNLGNKQEQWAAAQVMLQQGHSIEEVWAKTGFHQLPSGQLAWEINDENMAWKNPEELKQKIIDSLNLGNQQQGPMSSANLNALIQGMPTRGDVLITAKLSELIEHPDLFRNYPELENIVVDLRFGQRHKDLDGDVRTDTLTGKVTGMGVGNFNAVENKMTFYVDPLQIAAGQGFALDSIGAFAHELQHGIQQIESWMSGGTASMGMMSNLRKALEEDQRRIMQTHGGFPPFDSEDSKMLQKIEGWLNEINNETGINNQSGISTDKNEILKRQAIYERLQGEFQARATQERMDMTDEERAVSFPEDSQATGEGILLQNITRDEQIFSPTLVEVKRGQASVPGGLLNQNLDVINFVPRLKPSDFKRNNDGSYVGFDKSINTPQKITKLLTQLEGLATEGADAKMWYEDSSKQILDLVNGDKVEAEKIAQIIAIMSAETGVQVNTGFALKAYAQHKAGMPIEGMRFGKWQNDRITEVLNGISWEGRKTNSFYGNLMVNIDPTKMVEGQTTQDIWMARAFGLSGRPGDAQYKIMEEITQNIAAQNGWTPHQAQAAIWVATKARNDSMKSEIDKHVKEKGWGANANNIMPEHQEKFNKYFQKMVYDSEFNLDEFTDASYSFADGIADNLGFISLEAVPSEDLVDILPGIQNAPPEQKAEFTQSMYSIFLDENGVDLLAKEIGIPSPDGFMGFGGWKGDINPNMQVQGILSGTIKGGINPADVQLVELYAAVVGTVFKQDGVGYRRAFDDPAVSKQNGVDVDAGRRLTAEEHQKIYDALQKQFGHDEIQPTSTGTGVDIVQYLNWETKKFDIPNKEFQKMVEAAIIEADLGDDIHLGFYRSDGDLVSNDWKENPNGENYERYATEKSQSLYRQLVDKYSQEADKIRQEFGDKYGWGEVQEANVNEGLLKQTDEKLPNHLLE